MAIKKLLRKLIRAPYEKYVSFRRNMRDMKVVNEQIRISREAIPELSEYQKQEISQYWAKYGIEVPYQWHRLLYGKTGIKDPQFVPEPVFQRVIKPCMNHSGFAGVWGDKAYTDYFIRGVKTARSVVRNVNGRFVGEDFSLLTLTEAQKVLDQYETLVIKPSTFTDTGKGVKLLHAPFDLQELHSAYRKNYVIQIPLKQHPELAKLNASSINTIRVNSVLFDKEAHVMSAFIKVGQAGEFADNHGSDRYFIGIKEDGTFCDYAINHDLQKFDAIPSGYTFAGKAVPCYDAVCRAIEKAHACLPHFGFAFWDVCVNDQGEPVIVEVNLRYPDTAIPQVAGGPFFGKYTNQILAYISAERNAKK